MLFPKKEKTSYWMICLLLESPYFRSMFKNQWTEKKQAYIAIDIPDELMTVEGTHFSWGISK